MIPLDGKCSVCGCVGIHACVGRRVVRRPSEFKGFTAFIDRETARSKRTEKYNQCRVCGEHHNLGNLPCPTMRVTA